jgi:hypothetical protein
MFPVCKNQNNFQANSIFATSPGLLFLEPTLQIDSSDIKHLKISTLTLSDPSGFIEGYSNRFEQVGVSLEDRRILAT